MSEDALKKARTGHTILFVSNSNPAKDLVGQSSNQAR